MPMIIIFVDFSTPALAQKSDTLLKSLEELEPSFNNRFAFFWTTDPKQLDQRRILGVTWDELPALALNSLDHIVYAYPQGESFDKEKISHWLHEISLRKTAESDKVVKDFAVRQRDPTIQEHFLDKTIVADRDFFYNTILTEERDSILFIYSTENVNYVQRKAAFQFNLLIETLSNEELYPGLVGNKLRFYSYDAYVNAFPKGIPFLSSPP